MQAAPGAGAALVPDGDISQGAAELHCKRAEMLFLSGEQAKGFTQKAENE